MKNSAIFTEKDLVAVLDWVKAHKISNPYRRGGSSIKFIFNDDEIIFSSRNFAIYWLTENKSKFIGKEVGRITIL